VWLLPRLGRRGAARRCGAARRQAAARPAGAAAARGPAIVRRAAAQVRIGVPPAPPAGQQQGVRREARWVE
jgi:hypothetical protein